jgi:Fasciclin domain
VPFPLLLPIVSLLAPNGRRAVWPQALPSSPSCLSRPPAVPHHVVTGRLSSKDLKQQIKAGHGTAMLKTVSGGTLWAMLHGDDIVLKDEKGEWSKITQANVFQSNGVIHVIDTVVLPS